MSSEPDDESSQLSGDTVDLLERHNISLDQLLVVKDEDLTRLRFPFSSILEVRLYRLARWRVLPGGGTISPPPIVPTSSRYKETIPSKLPKFQVKETLKDGDPRLHLRKLEATLINHNVNPLRYVAALRHSLSNGPAELWGHNNLRPDLNISWSEAKAQFTQAFSSANQRDKDKLNYDSLVQGSKSVQSYGQQLIELIDLLNKQATSTSVLDKFRRGLNSTIQPLYLLQSRTHHLNSIFEAITLAREIEMSLSTEEMTLTRPTAPPSKERHKRQPEESKGGSNLKCLAHPNGSHTDRECRRHKRSRPLTQQSVDGTTPIPDRTGKDPVPEKTFSGAGEGKPPFQRRPESENICSICRKIGHWASRCPQRTMTSDSRDRVAGLLQLGQLLRTVTGSAEPATSNSAQ